MRSILVSILLSASASLCYSQNSHFNTAASGQAPISVQNTWRDTLYTMTTDVADQGASLTDTLKYSIVTGTYCGPPQSAYLQRGSSFIPVTLISTSGYPETIVVTFQIPQGADTGAYDLMLPGGFECENDTTFVPSAFTVKASASVASGDPYLSNITGIRVSPNPAGDNLTISFLLITPSHVHLRLYDGLGRTVATLCNRNLGTGPQSFEWLTQSIPAGCYFYEITTGQEMDGGRVCIRH